MRKSHIRTYLRGFLQVPTKKWKATIWLIDRGILASMALLVTVTAFMTRNGEALLQLGILGLLTFMFIYFFIAK